MKKLLEDLFNLYYKDVYSYLYSLSHDVSLSEELTADVFLDVVKSISSFRGEADIKTWLFSIARHKWYHYLRKKNKEIETELITDFLPSTEKLPEDICYRKQLVERIHSLLKLEPKRTQSIILMRLDGYSFHEIAIKHNITENTARVIDFRTKTKIRQILKKEGFDSD